MFVECFREWSLDECRMIVNEFYWMHPRHCSHTGIVFMRIMIVMIINIIGSCEAWFQTVVSPSGLVWFNETSQLTSPNPPSPKRKCCWIVSYVKASNNVHVLLFCVLTVSMLLPCHVLHACGSRKLIINKFGARARSSIFESTLRTCEPHRVFL
jgi:hypothetical protein